MSPSLHQAARQGSAASAPPRSATAGKPPDGLVERRFEMEEISVGVPVVVRRGKKVPVGTAGVVKWFGSTRFGWSVGLKVDGEEKLVFTSVKNVELDHTEAGKARAMDVAHESALWFDAKRAEESAVKAEAMKALETVGLKKFDLVTPLAGRYSGTKCKVIWVGATGKGLRAGVVPVAAPMFRNGRPVWPKYEPDWLGVEELAAFNAA